MTWIQLENRVVRSEAITYVQRTKDGWIAFFIDSWYLKITLNDAEILINTNSFIWTDLANDMPIYFLERYVNWFNRDTLNIRGIEFTLAKGQYDKLLNQFIK